MSEEGAAAQDPILAEGESLRGTKKTKKPSQFPRSERFLKDDLQALPGPSSKNVGKRGAVKTKDYQEVKRTFSLEENPKNTRKSSITWIGGTGSLDNISPKIPRSVKFETDQKDENVGSEVPVATRPTGKIVEAPDEEIADKPRFVTKIDVKWADS